MDRHASTEFAKENARTSGELVRSDGHARTLLWMQSPRRVAKTQVQLCEVVRQQNTALRLEYISIRCVVDEMIVSGSKLSALPGNGSSRLWFESHFSVSRPSLRLFCFPYAGGNAQAFRGWQRYFLPDIDLCLVHLPGRGKRIDEPMFTRLDLLVQTVADLITSEPQPPYALFGHSMGALISFELARELRRRHFVSPRRLFVSGRGAPTGASREVPRFNLPEEAFIGEVRRLNGTPRNCSTFRSQGSSCSQCFERISRWSIPINSVLRNLSHAPSPYMADFMTRMLPWRVCERGRNRPRGGVIRECFLGIISLFMMPAQVLLISFGAMS